MPDPFDDTDDDFLPQSDRLQILSPEEYDLLWGLPRLSQADRDLFFTLNPREEQALSRLRTPRTKLRFLLLLGYFRARQRFFRLDLDLVADESTYLLRRYLPGTRVTDLIVSDHNETSS